MFKIKTTFVKEIVHISYGRVLTGGAAQIWLAGRGLWDLLSLGLGIGNLRICSEVFWLNGCGVFLWSWILRLGPHPSNEPWEEGWKGLSRTLGKPSLWVIPLFLQLIAVRDGSNTYFWVAWWWESPSYSGDFWCVHSHNSDCDRTKNNS